MKKDLKKMKKTETDSKIRNFKERIKKLET